MKITVPPTRVAAPMGVIGAVLLAVSSWWVGAVPHAYQTHPPAALSWFPIGGIVPRTVFYAGLTLMMGAWLIVGRALVAADPQWSVRRLQRITLAWAAPMMAAMPLASRDLWAYAAQGNLIAHGLDPYRFAPAGTPGIFAVNMSPGWIHAPAPYGPLWLGLDHGLAVLYGDHVVQAAFVLRIPVLAGLFLLLWGVPRLAARAGIPPERAVWLAALNPLTIELVLGAGHNDLLMAGLMATGAALALRPGPALTTLVPAAAVMALAVGVKSPAMIGVAFTVPLWLTRPSTPDPWTMFTLVPEPPRQVAPRQLPSRQPARTPHSSRPQRDTPGIRQVVLATAIASLSALVSFTAVSLVTGIGLGWVHQVGASARTVNWLSLPTDAAILSDIVTGHVRGATHRDLPMEHWRTAGLAVAAVVLLALWLDSLAAVTGLELPRRRRSVVASPSAPTTTLGLALVAIIVLGPAVQLWYLCWALPFLGAFTRSRRGMSILVAVSIAMVYTVDPHGLSFTMKPGVVPIIALSALVGWWSWRVPAGAVSPSRDDHADRAGTGVHADGRSHL